MEVNENKISQLILQINDNDAEVPFLVRKSSKKIDEVIKKIYEKYKKGGRLFYVAAGTSGRIALLDAMDMETTFGVESNRFNTLMAGGNEALYISKDGDEDREDIAIEYLKPHELGENDIVIGLSASGRTPYVKSAIDFANKKGSLTVILANKENCEISKIAKLHIEIDPGKEFIDGSSRMKAATIQKMVLNTISTTLMILDGNVYKNMMINVKPRNKKIYNRCIEMITKITGCSEKEAIDNFNKTNNVKISSISIAKKVSVEEATLLSNQHKHLEEVLENE